MACGNLQNVTYDLCANSIGGIKKLWMTDAENITAINTGTIDAIEGEVVTGITMSSGTSKFNEFTLRRNTSDWSSEVQVGDNSTYVLTTLNIVLPRMDAAKRAAATSMLLAEAVGIVLDSNGKYWLLGSNTNPLAIEGGSAATGVNRDDSNNYTISVSTESEGFPYEIDPSIINGLIA